MIILGHPMFEYEIDEEAKEITVYEYMPETAARKIEEDIEHVIESIYDEQAQKRKAGQPHIDVNEYTITYPRNDKSKNNRTRVRAQNADIAEYIDETFVGKKKWRFP